MTTSKAVSGVVIPTLAECEAQIEKSGRTFFMGTGSALITIRDNRLYKDDYSDFDVYCKERWGFDRSRADQLISAAEMVRLLPAELTTNVVNEGVARAVQQVAKRTGKTPAEVVTEAVAISPGKVTALVVTSLIPTPTPKPAKKGAKPPTTQPRITDFLNYLRTLDATKRAAELRHVDERLHELFDARLIDCAHKTH